MTWRPVDSQPVMELYCIYWSPSDYPNKFVVRRWILDGINTPKPDPACQVFTRLTGARKSIPKGLIRIGRDAKDDKSIVEVWI